MVCPSDERLRLVEIPSRIVNYIGTGARVNFVLLTYVKVLMAKREMPPVMKS